MAVQIIFVMMILQLLKDIVVVVQGFWVSRGITIKKNELWCVLFADHLPIRCSSAIRCPLNGYELCKDYEYMMYCCC